MRSRRKTLVLVPFLLGAFAWPHRASAQSAEPPAARRGVDTSYGRIEGDIALVVGAGASVGSGAPRTAFDLRARFVDTLGLFVAYEDGPLVRADAEPSRVVSAGLELRPLFLGRWLGGGELGKPRLDLLIDSLGLELGVFVPQAKGGRFASRPGLQAGLGFELPVFPRASGLWIGLHGGGRWSDRALAGTDGGPSDVAAFAAITLAWHAFVGAHLVDIGQRAPR